MGHGPCTMGHGSTLLWVTGSWVTSSDPLPALVVPGAMLQRLQSVYLSPSPPPSSFELVPLKPARGSGERCKLPSGVGGGASVENEFCALECCQKAAGGNHFGYSECHVSQ